MSYTEEELRKLYVNEHKSASLIGRMYNVSSAIVCKDLYKIGIDVRSSRAKVVLNETILRKLYLEDKLSTVAIAKIIGCNQTNVVTNMIRYNIPARHKTEHLKGAHKPEHSKRMKELWQDGHFEGVYRPAGSENHKWKGGLKLANCLYCSKEFSMGPGRTYRYCSIKCSGLHRGLNGANNPNWQGGLSFLPYPDAFNRKFKQMIRDRDDNICQLCYTNHNRATKTGPQKHCVHHIDYIKENTTHENCITLCHSCNSRVNFDRWFWQSLFTALMEDRCNRNSTQTLLTDIFNLQTNVIEFI
jgi:hypothetical protein